MYPVSRPCGICIGDGTNWSEWVKTQELDSEKLAKNEEDVKKFYKWAGPNFVWPPTMDFGEQGEGEELATNTLAYHRFLNSGQLDPSKGSHILLINGQIVRYGEEISKPEYNELLEKHPGMFYAPIKAILPIRVRR
ncbi:6591_t:CDS:2 [Scutellospora calospora]|uniref:6591_t:CDS:1 n=1 Tax=Scutellospora calospora TaxID=85575 RepID=A0ACA9JU68_9GLOM|nr:6591_t:CDS:2 [Scutellospora calospora]